MSEHALENLEPSNLPSSPYPDTVLHFNKSNGQFVRNGKEVTPAETQSLIASAQALIANDFFQALTEELCREGYRQMATAPNWETIQFGKACLYIADLAKRKAANAARLPIPKPRPGLPAPLEEEE
jgi:hypothetical protein